MLPLFLSLIMSKKTQHVELIESVLTVITNLWHYDQACIHLFIYFILITNEKIEKNLFKDPMWSHSINMTFLYFYDHYYMSTTT